MTTVTPRDIWRNTKQSIVNWVPFQRRQEQQQQTNGEDSAEEVLGAFVSQYYAEQPAPQEIVLDREIPEAELIEQAIRDGENRSLGMHQTFQLR